MIKNYYRGTSVPCLFVAAKSDQPAVMQNYQIDPEEFTTKYNLCPPEQFSSLELEHQLSSATSQQPQTPAAGGGRGRRSGSADPSSNRSSTSTVVGASSTLTDQQHPGSLHPSHRVAAAAASHTTAPAEVGLDGLVSNNNSSSNRPVNGRASPGGGSSGTGLRTRRFSGTELDAQLGGPAAAATVDGDVAAAFAPVYVTLCTLANFP